MSLRTLSLYIILQCTEERKYRFIEQYPYEKEENYFDRRKVFKIILEFMKNNNLEKINFKSSLFITPGYEFKLCDQYN